MFNKHKKTDKSGVVVAPVPVPPEDKKKDKANSLSSHNTLDSDANVFVKVPPSVLSGDLTVKGNLLTSGDIQVEGKVEGDIQAHLLTVGETSEIKGEIRADDVIINGQVVGTVRGLKVRLTNKARVKGDIIHKAIAIESGAHFEGSVERKDNPLEGNLDRKK
jgi:cytoskeletal protein CcmA (bactofilin family)